MLVLSRKVGETIVIPHYDLTVTIVRVKGDRVRLGLSAPKDVTIYREEIARRRSSNDTRCATRTPR